MNSDKKMMYTIYGLKIKGNPLFFYIGVTKYSPSSRLYQHISYAKSGNDSNEKKCKILSENENNIDVVELREMVCLKEFAYKKEAEYIYKYIEDGHPLVNKMPDSEPTKTIRISNRVHRKAKIYAAETKSSILDVLDCALLWYMNEFPANSKSIRPKSKTKHQ